MQILNDVQILVKINTIIYSYITRLISLFIALGLLIELKNNIRSDQLDQIFLYLSFIPVYVNLAKFGSNTPIISRIMKEENIDCYIAQQVFTILLASIIIPMAHLLIFVSLPVEYADIIPKLVAITFLLAMMSFFVSIYQARSDYIRVYMFQGIYGVALSLPIILLIEMGIGLDLSSFLLVFMLLCLVTMVYLLSHNNMWKTMSGKVTFAIRFSDIKNNAAYFINDSGWYLVIAICSWLVITNMQSGALSEFTIVLRFGMTLVLIQQATNLVFGPRVAKRFLDGNKKEAVKLYLLSAAVTSITALIAISIFLLSVNYFDIEHLIPVKMELLNIVFIFIMLSFVLGPSENVNVFLGRKLPILVSNIIGVLALLFVYIFYSDIHDIRYYIALAMLFMLTKKITNTTSVYLMKM